jgi:hypothetical protein
VPWKLKRFVTAAPATAAENRAVFVTAQEAMNPP